MVCDHNQNKKRIKQWFWFIGLWLGGIFTMTMLAYAIKALIRLM